MGRNTGSNASAQNAVPEWVKQVEANGARTFAEIRPQLEADREKEFPDFGADVPEGVYFTTTYGCSHEWKSRNGSLSTIRTMFIRNEAGDTYEVAFASFVGREYPFVDMNGNEQSLPFILPFDASATSVARRNLRVLDIPADTRIRINHIRGHWNNPFAQRVFNINLTYVSEVQ